MAERICGFDGDFSLPSVIDCNNLFTNFQAADVRWISHSVFFLLRPYNAIVISPKKV